LAPGADRLTGFIVQFAGAPGDAASRLREYAVCKGSFSGLCTDEVDSRMTRFDASTDEKTRQALLSEVQAYLLDNYLMLPMPRNVLLNVGGPRLANKPTDVIGAIPQYPFVGPYEDLQVTD
jgi:ABC-type transport system substrate-binding protein